MTTNKNTGKVTNKQIYALRIEAIDGGNVVLADMCADALAGDPWSIEAAADIIAENAARRRSR